jgi:hypothetical protein
VQPRYPIALAALGYLGTIAGQLNDPVTVVLLALAGAGGLAAALAWPSVGAPLPAAAAAGLALLALARVLQATKGLLIGNWPFAAPAWIVALGLAMVAGAAWPAWRSGEPLGPGARAGFAAACLGTCAISAWLASTGNMASLAFAALTALGFGGAWLGLAPHPAPAASPRRGGA